MNETAKIIFGLVGGLAMFLFGMNSMSDALQKAAGEKMKKVLGFLTKNPLMGALAGALVTAVLQSSSATTVMVIGFVSAGLMSLPQAISVIFGANIGTTITALLASIGQSKNAKRTAVAELRQCIEIAQNLFAEAMDSVINGDSAEAEIVIKNRGKMRKAQKKNTKAHLNRVEKKICDPALTQAYSRILYNLDRVADNCVSIAEETMDGVVFVKLEEEQMEEIKLELEAAV